VNAGGFDGDRIVDSRGIELADSDPNPTVLYRAGLDLNTSFFGTDLLLVRLEGATGALENGIPNGALDNAAGVLEPNFGSVLDYTIKPPTVGGDVGIGRLLYTFTPVQDFTVTIGPDIRTTDFVDRNSYANLSFLDFSTQAFVNNFILFPVDGPTAGAALNWNPGQGAFSVRALYAGADPANPSDEGPIISTSTFTRVLYPSCAGGPNAGGSNAPGPSVGSPSVGSPIAGGPGVGGPSVGDPITDNPIAAGSIACGERGLFGDTYQGTVEVEFAPSRTFALRLQYSGGKLFDNSFDVIGANFELTLARNFGVFGRYGYGGYDDTAYGDIEPNYWMAGVAMRDLFQEGALAGAAVGQPFIASEIGDATQTNFEVFYNYPFSRNIQVTPTIQVITNAANQDSNGTIVTGTLRTVLSF
jgi:porin